LSLSKGRAWSGVAESRRILILFAHPALRKSRINRRLIAEARKLSGITVRDLYEEYPDFMIDVKAEQALLESHDVILFQHPFYWYSCPAILKEWLDLVLEHGFAYGAEGKALEGKWQGSIISTGGPESAYGPGRLVKFSVRELLAPFEQTARLCRMTWLPPFLVQGSFLLEDAALERHAVDYVRVLELLRDGATDVDSLVKLERLNQLVEGGLV
jgi:glutathione-regulated potassium-efflux system ancillary protein KefG